jgi:protein-S-isoprenylcysteine O-methyltransferase Ste14
MMDAWREPFFWALLSMTALVAGDAIAANVLPRSRALGLAIIGSFMLGRTLLVLPFCAQPRFELAGATPLGLGLMLAGLAIMLPVLRVDFSTGPSPTEALRTSGVYGFVRHPGYLGSLLLGLGWAILFRSTIGVALTPVWWLASVFHALIEEASLERSHGAAYREYRARVPGRMLPGLPI